jgi:hypothetical protein
MLTHGGSERGVCSMRTGGPGIREPGLQIGEHRMLPSWRFGTGVSAVADLG